jgi:hypothetical protein
MSDELRRVRDTLVEELRRSDRLTVAGKALYARYAAMCEADTAAPPPPPPAPEPARPVRPAPAEEDEEFGGSFMVRPTPVQTNIPGYRETPTELPRSLRDRRR